MQCLTFLLRKVVHTVNTGGGHPKGQTMKADNGSMTTETTTQVELDFETLWDQVQEWASQVNC